MSQSHSTSFQPKSETSTFQSPYSQPTTMKTSSSSYNFTAPSSGSYSTHPQPSRSDRPTAVTPLPLHLQSKGGKIGGPVGNVSLHSSNDSGFSNDPPPQPEIDYSDDESISGVGGGGQTKIPPRWVLFSILSNIWGIVGPVEGDLFIRDFNSGLSFIGFITALKWYWMDLGKLD